MLTLWNGFDRTLNHELRKMDRLMADAFRSDTARPAMSSPKVDVLDEEGAIVLRADVPGMTADDITITLHEGVLVIEGALSVDEEKTSDDATYLFRERRDLSFKRSFKLGHDLQADSIEAAVKDGVLTVTMPKQPQAQPRQIAVSAK